MTVPIFSLWSKVNVDKQPANDGDQVSSYAGQPGLFTLHILKQATQGSHQWYKA